MKRKITRRGFIGGSAAAGLAAGFSSGPTILARPQTGPLVISSPNGLRATEKAMQMLRSGADTLDAVIAGVNIVEDDP